MVLAEDLLELRGHCRCISDLDWEQCEGHSRHPVDIEAPNQFDEIIGFRRRSGKNQQIACWVGQQNTFGSHEADGNFADCGGRGVAQWYDRHREPHSPDKSGIGSPRLGRARK